MIDLIFGLIDILFTALFFRGLREVSSPQYSQNELIGELDEPIIFQAVIIGALSSCLFGVMFAILVSSAIEISDFMFLIYWLFVGAIAGPIGGLRGAVIGKASKIAMAMGGIFLMPIGCIMFVSDINFLIFVGAIFAKLWLVVMLNLGLLALFFYAREKGKLPSVAAMSLLTVVVLLEAGFFLRPWWISRCLPDCPNRNLSEIELAGHNLRGANLSGANLSGAKLHEANLTEASLYEANLSGADLARTDLIDINLSGANLREANLAGADLTGANLSGADLFGADLFGADLRGANLSRANFNEADLNRVILNEAKIDNTTQIDDKSRLVWEIVNQGGKGRDLSGRDLSDARMGEANMSEVDLSGADLSGTDLSGATLAEADLSGADLTDTNLSGANLYKADLSQTNLHETDLRGADLHGANLTEANLSGDLSWAFLMDTDLRGANFSKANLHRVYLHRADLRRANFSEANLHLVYLPKADLTDAYLGGANLREADLSFVRLEGATYNVNTIWPPGFDPEAAGAVLRD